MVFPGKRQTPLRERPLSKSSMALRRGLSKAEKVAVIAGGARYNWEIAALHFPDCIQIVDLYHAREHLHDLCAMVIPEGGTDLTRLQTVWRTMLDEGRVNEIIAGAALLMSRSGPRRKKIEKEIGYFNNNAHPGPFRRFRRGRSGLQNRDRKTAQAPAMKWTVRGANSIIAFRCCHRSGRMEDFWEQRAA